jgi:hypothetical protein
MPYLFKSSEEENTAWRGALSPRRRWKKQPQKAHKTSVPFVANEILRKRC